MEVASVESVESVETVETVETVRMLDMVVLVCGGDAPELWPRWRVHFIFRQQTRPRHVNRRTLNLPRRNAADLNVSRHRVFRDLNYNFTN
jgi:hypothetical protein